MDPDARLQLILGSWYHGCLVAEQNSCAPHAEQTIGHQTAALGASVIRGCCRLRGDEDSV